MEQLLSVLVLPFEQSSPFFLAMLPSQLHHKRGVIRARERSDVKGVQTIRRASYGLNVLLPLDSDISVFILSMLYIRSSPSLIESPLLPFSGSAQENMIGKARPCSRASAVQV